MGLSSTERPSRRLLWRTPEDSRFCSQTLWVIISDMFDGVSHNFLIVHDCLAGYFSTNHDHSSLGHGLTSNFSIVNLFPIVHFVPSYPLTSVPVHQWLPYSDWLPVLRVQDSHWLHPNLLPFHLNKILRPCSQVICWCIKLKDNWRYSTTGITTDNYGLTIRSK